MGKMSMLRVMRESKAAQKWRWVEEGKRSNSRNTQGTIPSQNTKGKPQGDVDQVYYGADFSWGFHPS